MNNMYVVCRGKPLCLPVLYDVIFELSEFLIYIQDYPDKTKGERYFTPYSSRMGLDGSIQKKNIVNISLFH